MGPSCVLWGLTRGHSAFKVQPNGSKSRRECFNSDPQNLTNLHNASAQGFTNPSSIGITGEKAASKSGKQFRRVYHLRVGHKSYHNSHGAVLKKGTSARLNASDVAIRRETARAANVIKGLTSVTERRRAMLYRRLGRLHSAYRV